MDFSLDHSCWNGEKVILDLGHNNSGSESDDSDYYNNIKPLKGNKKKKDADKNFDVEVRSLGSTWEEDLSDSDEEDHGGIPKNVSATDIIGTARTRWAEYQRVHMEAAEAAWEADAREAEAREYAEWEEAQKDFAYAQQWQEAMDLEHAQAEAAAQAAGQEAAKKAAQAEAAAHAAEHEAAKKATEGAASAASQEGAQKPAGGSDMTSDEMDLGDQGDAEPSLPKGPSPQGTVPQENTIPVTPNPKDGAPAASERSAGHGA